MRVLIIGAGPAGLMAAISALEFGRDVSVEIWEKKAHPGRKLLLSGSGRCNLTHRGELSELLSRFGGRDRFLRSAFYGFSNDDLVDFFKQRGVSFVTEESGKIFPSSGKAGEILSVLRRELEASGGVLRTDRGVTALRSEESGFVVEAGDAEERFDRVIVAAGGASYPVTGSDGSGARLAGALGHRIEPLRPALAGVRLVNPFPVDLAGVSFRDLSVTLVRGGRRKNRAGDVVITHQGLSGPGILDFSRDFRPHDLLELDFTARGGDFDAELRAALDGSGKAQISSVLQGFGLQKRLVRFLLSEAKVPSERKAAELGKKARQTIVALASRYPAEIKSLGSWDEAMATAGGVDLSEVSPKTMESRICRGLFFAGEVLDIDGDTGGYNLQAAFSTGHLAGRSAVS